STAHSNGGATRAASDGYASALVITSMPLTPSSHTTKNHSHPWEPRLISMKRLITSPTLIAATNSTTMPATVAASPLPAVTKLRSVEATRTSQIHVRTLF